ncbi:hypothetical protein ACFWZ2_12770 [Streptomyces sp. NPDC059002]|uniref:hypothetical protein n=1 Tax=Streptomyces sp. NPDC059002 TaxID=3346690 RepID=UPI0036AC285E
MESEVLAAVIGVPATVITAAIAYPVGRGVARRQAADQHEQWLRAERRGASQVLADAATAFIEESNTVWEAVVRPDYAHTRRRDVEARKRLDPALYEPLRQKLSALHNALPAVALHGPDDVTTAGQHLYDTALAGVGELLRLDAACVQRSLMAHQSRQDQAAQQRAAAAVEDLDTAYARLAAPFGLPEFATDVADALHGTSVISAVLRIMTAFEDPSIAPEAIADLRAAVADDPELKVMAEPLLQLAPLLQLQTAVQAYQDGQTEDPLVLLSSAQTALPGLLGVTGMIQELLAQVSAPDDTEGEAADDSGVAELRQLLAGTGDLLSGPASSLQQIQQYMDMGDDLVATTAESGETNPLLVSAAWASGLRSLVNDPVLTNHLTLATAQTQLINSTIEATFARRIHTQNDLVRDAKENLSQARIAFLDTARRAIGAG